MPQARIRRKRRTRAQWMEILRRFESSGLSRREFCVREGLAPSSFQRWRAESPETPAAKFVEWKPAGTPEASPRRGWTVELSLPNGMHLRLEG